MVDQLVTWLSEGIQVVLEDGQIHIDVVPIDPACERVPTSTKVARVLDDLVKPERDPG